MDSIQNVLFEVGKSIATDRNVVSASQNFLTTTANGLGQIATATVGSLMGSGSLTATTSAVGTSISSAAAGVGHAIMSSSCVSFGITLLNSPILPIVAAGGLFWWLCSDD